VTAIAPVLQSFFTDRLMTQLHASPHTVASYRDTIRLLLAYASARHGKEPSRLDFTDLDATVIGAFLTDLETGRGNGVTTRNARLTAVHSLFRYASLHAPEHAALIARVLAIPGKRHDHPTVCFLTRDEIAALLAAPATGTWAGRRDHALLTVGVQTGLRVSELTGLTVGDAVLGTGPHVTSHGKGRKERATPLTPATADILRNWLAERGGTAPDPLFPSRRGTRLSRDAVEHLVARHAVTAARTCPSIAAKHVTPHVMRHSAAMSLLHAGIDITVIALWLGHESPATTRVYLHADMKLKEQALARLAPGSAPEGRYTPPDSLLAFLDAL
jgi:site-specific recombinase XerD